MAPPQSVTNLLLTLTRYLTPRRRLQLSMLFLLVIVTSVAESISIGAVIPFLAVLITPQTVFEHAGAQPFIHLLKLETPSQLVIPLTVAFACAAISAGGVRLLLLWATTRWSYAAGADLSRDMYKRTLYQPYIVHTSRNSSTVIAGISNKVNSVIFKIMQVINLIGAAFILTGILITLLVINATIAISATLGFGLIYASIMWLIREHLNNNSDRIGRESTQVIKALQEGLGGIRDILLDGTQAIYCKQYESSDLELRRAQASNAFLSSSPRHLVESVSMLLIALLTYLMTRGAEGLEAAVPTLGALALGAQRMLPAMQMAYSAWAGLKGERQSMSDTIELLEQNLPAHAGSPTPVQMAYRNRIELTDVSFRYGTKAPWILRNISLTIEKGSRVGLIGATGTGKSTLVDVIMGLLQPNAGTITVDGKPITSKNLRQWQGCIAHVPQSIFLADSTIEDNIAFGLSPTTIDRSRVRLAAEQAQIHEVIQSLPQGYQTLVGERGVRLSGGQRQRIGIARALYKRAQIIVFDEATSALDEKTESSVISAIEKLHPDLTILMIAHRISTLKNCSKIIELGHQGAQEIGNYRDLAEREAPQNQVIPIRTDDSQGADSVASDSGSAVTTARSTLNNSATN